MRVNVTRNDFELIPVLDECKDNFISIAKQSQELSDFEAWGLKLAGDALRPKSSQHFWCNGAYCWFTDGKQDHEQCVFITRFGSLMFEDITRKELYRVRDIVK